MSIIRWFLSHSLAIVFLILLILLYSIRDSISRDYINLVGRSAPAQANELKAQPPRTVEQKKKGEKHLSKDTPKDDTAGSSTASENQNTNDPWREALNDVALPAAAGKPVINPGSESNFPPENYDPESGALDENTLPPVASAISGRQFTPANKISAERAAPASQEYFTELRAARRLYWQGQAGLAQAAYERLMFEYQNLPEAADELGNLLLQQGDKNGATWAYKNAIPRYLNLHREQEAISIIQLLSQYDPVTAEKLQKKYW